MGLPDVANLIKNPSELLERLGLTPAKINDIVIDVLRSELPTHDFEVTEHPVETGISINDTKIKRPLVVSLDAIFTDAETDAVGVVTKFIGTGQDLLATWQEKKTAIYELMNSNELITVTTEHDTYPDMLLTSVRPIRERGNTRAWFVQLDFKHISIVSSEVASVSEADLPAELKEEEKETGKDRKKERRKQKKKDNRGKEQAKEATQPRKSILRQLAEGLGVNYG